MTLTKLGVDRVKLENRTSAPSGAIQGQMYYNTTDKKVYVYDGTSWNQL